MNQAANELRRMGSRAMRGCLLLLYFSPILYLIVQALRGWDADTYARILDVDLLPLMLRTVGVASGATLLAALLGGAVAVVFEARSFPCRGVFRALAFAPLLLPPVFQIAVWERLAEPGGVLCTLLPFATSMDKPFPIRNPYCAVVILGLNYSPLIFFFMSHGLRRIARELVDAARLERRAVTTFFRVQLPLAMPAIIAGMGITFTFTLLNYEVPRLLDVNTYPVLVNLKFEGQILPGQSFVFALPLLALTTLLLLGAEGWASRRGFALSGRERDVRVDSCPRPGILAWVSVGGWWLITAGLPLTLLVSLAGSARNFVQAFATDWEKMLWSALVCFSTSLITVSIAAVTTLTAEKPRPRMWTVVLWLPLALPGTLLGSALVHFRGFVPEWLVPLYDSWWILVIAGVLRFFPLAYFALQAHLRTVPDSLWMAARFEARWSRRLSQVALPLAWPGLLLGAVAVALFQSQELAATILLAPPGAEPLLLRIYNLLHYDPEQGTLAALCAFHLASVVLVLGAFFALRPRSR